MTDIADKEVNIRIPRKQIMYEGEDHITVYFPSLNDLVRALMMEACNNDPSKGVSLRVSE